MSPARGARILAIDDEPAILRALRTNLSGHGYEVQTAETAAAALEWTSRHWPDVILLDLGLPDQDGLQVIQAVRAHADTPIIVLSARGAEHDRVQALDLGADDFLTKPFGVDELLARIRVALRHSARPASGAAPVFEAGPLRVDFDRRQVTVGGREVKLTPNEYDLLKTFVAHPNKVLTHRMLLQAVWGPDYGDEGHYLHVYVASLRRKLEPDPRTRHFFQTEPGVGYRFRVDE